MKIKYKKCKMNLIIHHLPLMKMLLILSYNNLKNIKKYKNKITKDNQNQKNKKKMNQKKSI